MTVNHYYLDGSATGLNNGTSWANAWTSLDTALASIDTRLTGDEFFLWVRGTTTHTIGTSFNIGWHDHNEGQFLNMIGVKAATTNEPPTASDIIPGYRNGGSATRAQDQTGANLPPLIELTGANNDWTFYYSAFKAYGIRFESADEFNIEYIRGTFEECSFTSQTNASSLSDEHFFTWADNMCDFYDCTFTIDNPNGTIFWKNYGTQRFRWFNCDFHDDGTVTTMFSRFNGSGPFGAELYGCDLTGLTALTVGITSWNAFGTKVVFKDCLVPSGWVESNIHLGSRMYFGDRGFGHGNGVSRGVSPLGTGESAQDAYYSMPSGTVTQETGTVRSGGASDGASGEWCWALDPVVLHQSQVSYLDAPERSGIIEGDGTAKTFTIYIANDGGSDLYDDEVWVEYFGPSTDGDIQGEFVSTKLDYGSTRAVLTDDTVSDWGSGAGSLNAQKITFTVTPKYTGPYYYKVYYGKQFTASPTTLFVDPAEEIS